MSDLLWGRIKDEFEHNNCADVVRLEIDVIDDYYYLVRNVDAHAAFLIHVDEFADMFGNDVQRRVNERLSKYEVADITVAIEAD